MNLKLQNTNTIVVIDGVPNRIWEGKNEKGVKVTAFISRLSVEDFNADQFKKELDSGSDCTFYDAVPKKPLIV